MLPRGDRDGKPQVVCKTLEDANSRVRTTTLMICLRQESCRRSNMAPHQNVKAR